MTLTTLLLTHPALQETGDDTGVFQTVVTLPSASLYPGGNTGSTAVTIDYGEAVTLTYIDVGLSGERYY